MTMTPMQPIARAALAIAVTSAAPAVAGPDFVTADRAAPLAASDARSVQEPMDDIVFPLDVAAPSATALDQVAAVVRWLGVHPGYRVVVEGHTDSSGAANYNAALGTRRAVLVANRLIDSGVDPDRVVIAVYGENGARRRPDSLDRRVVMFATAAPLSQLISAELDRNALEVTWTHLGTRLSETRGITPIASAGTGRPISGRPTSSRR
jgi:outer membrane protein OmpA-like peptidoglycan-associated protein